MLALQVFLTMLIFHVLVIILLFQKGTITILALILRIHIDFLSYKPSTQLRLQNEYESPTLVVKSIVTLDTLVVRSISVETLIIFKFQYFTLIDFFSR